MSYEPLRRQLGALSHLTRLLLRGTTPAAFALLELPPLRVGCDVPSVPADIVDHGSFNLSAIAVIHSSDICRNPLFTTFAHLLAGIGTSGLLRSGHTAGAITASF